MIPRDNSHLGNSPVESKDEKEKYVRRLKFALCDENFQKKRYRSNKLIACEAKERKTAADTQNSETKLIIGEHIV